MTGRKPQQAFRCAMNLVSPSGGILTFPPLVVRLASAVVSAAGVLVTATVGGNMRVSQASPPGPTCSRGSCGKPH